MSPPTPKVVNVCKSARESEGYKSFVAWYDDEKNVYIGRNAGKYTQRGVNESKWANPFICSDWDVAKAEWVVEDLMRCYEKYVRKSPLLMNSLHELGGKKLGCWCKPGPCHGDILVKIFTEKYGNDEPVTKKSKKSDN